MVTNPELPLDYEFEDTSHREKERFAFAVTVNLIMVPIFTSLLHAAPFTQPTKPGDITGMALWFICALLSLIPSMIFTGFAGMALESRYKKADKAKPAPFYALLLESARWVKLFQRESKAVLELEPEPDLYFLVQDAQEQVRLWQLRLIEAFKQEKLSEQASIEIALRNAAVDMTHLRLSLEKQREDNRAVYEEALLETPVNIGAQARAIEAGEPLIGEPILNLNATHLA